LGRFAADAYGGADIRDYSILVAEKASMKTRTAFIYLAVFLLLAGYFYYFEVVRRQALREKEDAALHLFQIEKSQVNTLQLEKKDLKLRAVKQNGQWQIIEPISTWADGFAVNDVLSTLQSLKMERQVQGAAQDLQLYGLDKPALHLSFKADGTTHQLRIGAKAAVANQYYASGDQENRVVLIGAAQQQSLDKSLFDLRSKEFFTFKSDEVHRLEIVRPEGSLVVARLDKENWQDAAGSEMKIKNSKVERLLNRLLLLRAQRFVEAGEDDMARFGLQPARFKISLAAKGKTETLLLGNNHEEETIYAKGDNLPWLALVDEKVLEEIPASLSDLQDRTLLSLDSDQVKAVIFKMAGATSRLERQGKKWHWVGAEDFKVVENWRVNSLLWKIKELEYLPDALPKIQFSPENPELDLVLLQGNEEKLATFSLNEVPAEKAERGILWFSEKGEAKRPYWLSAESLRELHESAKKLVTPES
jgi:hypothetical protein